MMRPHSWAPILLAALLLGGGCRGDDAPSGPDAAEAAVRSFFAAVEAGDCDRIRSELSADELSASDCEGLLTDFRERDARLIEVLSVKPDGRNPALTLVTVQVEFQHKRGNQHEWVIQVRRDGSAWRVHPPR